MDSLHSVLRAIRGETKQSRDHLSIFREFLDHLDRISRRTVPRPRTVKQTRPRNRRLRKG